MRKVLREFRAFSMGGNMVDLALGFIIGAAFSKLVESFSQNIIMDLVAAIFGQPDFASLNVRIHNSKIELGVFLSQLVSFLLLAWVLFLLVKMISVFGLTYPRIFEERECPYCLERVAPRALICKTCGQQLVDELPSLAEAEKRAADMRARRLSLPPMPMPARRRETIPGGPDAD
ncbi:MAG: large conductance mechanosensitive channel protein MscL [Gemmatimonadales bacterium]